jgi:glycosyltransferase involved in cell wall biosynthesis
LKVSLIIPTYNQPEYLGMALASAAVQTEREFEVVVADDGSLEGGAHNKAVIERYQKRFGMKIKHLWHEDEGFRKTVIVNKAVAAADGDLLIFNDGDCVMHEQFVMEHISLLRRGSFCIGRTPRIFQKLSTGLTEADLLARRFQRVHLAMILDGLFGESRKVEFGLYLSDPLSYYIARKRKRNRDLWGGNFSCFRDDFIAVNGFNEDFMGWGQEDSELGVRLNNLGLEAKVVANRAINFHLWHTIPPDRPERYVNNAQKLQNIADKLVRCPNGIDKYLR